MSFTAAQGPCGPCVSNDHPALLPAEGPAAHSALGSEELEGPLQCKVQTLPWSQEAPSLLTCREQPLPALLPPESGACLTNVCKW